MRRLLLWVPPIVYMAFIFHFSSQSDPLPQVTSLVWDKALHLSEYALLGLLLCRAFRGEALAWPLAVVAAVIVATLYGATDEWHQAYVPLRTADPADWLADTLGGGIGASAYAFSRPWRFLRR